jgi:hypothetical protein
MRTRYITNTLTAANTNTSVNSTGKDYGEYTFSILCVAGQAANAAASTLLTWTGSGTIKQISSVTMRGNTGNVIACGITAATATNFSIDATGKIITMQVANGGVSIPANTTIIIKLIIGNY